MAQKVGKIAKEKKPFDKTYIPLTIAIILLVLFVGGLIFTIVLRPKDKPTALDTNTLQIEDVKVDNTNTVCSNDEIKKLTDDSKKIVPYYNELSDHLFGVIENENNADDDGNAPLEEVRGYALEVVLTGGNPNLYAMVYNDRDDDISFKDFKNDTETWVVEDTRRIRKYTIRVFANTESCKDVLVREFEFSIPKWNETAKMAICKDPIIADEDICQHFTFENRNMRDTFSHFNEVYEKKIKEQEKQIEENKKKKGVMDYIKQYMVWIIVAALVLVAIVVGVIIYIMKGRNKNENNN